MCVHVCACVFSKSDPFYYIPLVNYLIKECALMTLTPPASDSGPIMVESRISKSFLKRYAGYLRMKSKFFIPNIFHMYLRRIFEKSQLITGSKIKFLNCCFCMPRRSIGRQTGLLTS